MATKVIENWPLSIDHPTVNWRLANIRINLISLETTVLGEHFCRWQYGSIFIRFHMVLFSKARQHYLIKPTTKTDLAKNGISLSLNVKHFRVSGKPIRHFTTPRNSIASALKVP